MPISPMPTSRENGRFQNMGLPAMVAADQYRVAAESRGVARTSNSATTGVTKQTSAADAHHGGKEGSHGERQRDRRNRRGDRSPPYTTLTIHGPVILASTDTSASSSRRQSGNTALFIGVTKNTARNLLFPKRLVLRQV